jgi:hypothetical protein
MFIKLFAGAIACGLLSLISGCQAEAPAQPPKAQASPGAFAVNSTGSDVLRPADPTIHAVEFTPKMREPAQSQRITTADVAAWSRRGISDEIIIDRIERSTTVFYLTAKDETELRDRGVSEATIRAMRNTSRR